MNLKEIQELIGTLDASNLSEIEIEEEGCRIRLTKAIPEIPAPQQIHVSAAPTMSHPIQVMSHVAPNAQMVPAAPVATSNEAAAIEPEVDDGLVTIDSPMVGTFYSAPSPSDPPFVKFGDTVEEGQTICIVEAMKLMNEVSAKFHCVIEKVLVENAEPVEFGQPLYSVRPI